MAATYDSDTCPVGAMAHLVAKRVSNFGETFQTDRAKEAVFTLSRGQVLTRGQVSEILRTAAQAAGIPGAKLASHSLRRGGCSAYSLSRACDISALALFGRWESDTFKKYLYRDTDVMTEAQREAHSLVPKYELR